MYEEEEEEERGGGRKDERQARHMHTSKNEMIQRKRMKYNRQKPKRPLTSYIFDCFCTCHIIYIMLCFNHGSSSFFFLSLIREMLRQNCFSQTCVQDGFLFGVFLFIGKHHVIELLEDIRSRDL